MLTKITEPAIKAAETTGKLYYLRDSGIPGFWVRITPAGAKSYVFRYPVSPSSGRRSRSTK